VIGNVAELEARSAGPAGSARRPTGDCSRMPTSSVLVFGPERDERPSSCARMAAALGRPCRFGCRPRKLRPCQDVADRVDTVGATLLDADGAPKDHLPGAFAIMRAASALCRTHRSVGIQPGLVALRVSVRITTRHVGHG